MASIVDRAGRCALAARADAASASPPRSWWCFWSRRRSCFYPVFLMKALCFALFACAFNLLIGYVGLVSFGHALLFRLGELSLPPMPPRSWGLPAGACRV